MGFAAQVDEAPEIPFGHEGCLTSFWRLSSDRGWIVQGLGSAAGTVIESAPGRISFAAIDCFARRFQIAGEEFDRFLFFVSEMDAEFLNVWQEKASAKHK